MGKKFHMTSTGDLHVLEIINPTVDDEGKITCQCLDTACSGILEVDEPDPIFKFIKLLPKSCGGHTGKEVVLECTANSHKATVWWYKNDVRLNPTEKIILDHDSMGRKFLKIIDAVPEDSGLYTCKMQQNQEEKTMTTLTVADQKFQIMKPLKSRKVQENDTVTLECEVDEWEAKVTWWKKDKDGNVKELKPEGKKGMEISSEGRKRRLVIKKAKVSDEGEYTCKTNDDETTAELIVERKFLSFPRFDPHLIHLFFSFQ